MNCKTILFWTLLPLLVAGGCQSGKWKMPAMPKMAIWKNGPPRLFAKKDKELGPPPRHFGDSEAMAENEMNLELEPGTPKSELASNRMPSEAMEPERAITRGASTHRNGVATRSPDPQREFVTPPVAASGSPEVPKLREPYEYKPPANDSLKQAAQQLANDFDRGAEAASSFPNRLAGDFQAPAAATANAYQNEFNSGLSSMGDRRSAVDGSPSTATMNPGSIAQSTSPPESFSSDSSFAGGFANRSNSPLAPVSSQPVSNASIQTGPSVASNQYVRTPQADNGFDRLTPNGDAMSPNRTSASSAGAASPTNDLAAAAIESNQAVGNDFQAAAGTSAAFPTTRSSEYVRQVPPAAVPDPRQARIAELPQELMSTKGNYTPGSTGKLLQKNNW